MSRRECGMYNPTTNLICTEPLGHDPAHGELAFREAQHEAFVARQHEGKRPYDSKSAAKRAAGMTSATFGGRPKEPYRCEVCGSWHVGSVR